VFDGVLAPSLLAVEEAVEEMATPEAAVQQETVPEAPSAAEPAIHCATDCVDGCRRPEACLSAEALSRVEALLSSRSLDDLVSLATNSLEARTRARFSRDDDPGR
jgi:diaminopimelate epimerase